MQERPFPRFLRNTFHCITGSIKYFMYSYILQLRINMANIMTKHNEKLHHENNA